MSDLINIDYGIQQLPKKEKRTCTLPCHKSAQKLNPLLKELREKQIYKDLYAIGEHGIEYTQTFKPEIHNRFTPTTLTSILSELLSKYIKRYHFKVIMIGEFSQVGQYHMHGCILAPPQMINSLRRRLPRELGRAELKTISYLESYCDYCFKDEYTGYYKDLNKTEILTVNY